MYAITYIAPDPGCAFEFPSGTVAEPPTLSPTGVVGANEFCGGSPRAFIYDHGVRTQLPLPDIGINSINSSKHAIIATNQDAVLILDLQTGNSVLLQGPQPVASQINDSGFAAGANGIDCDPIGCLPDPARFAPDGSYKFLSTQSGFGKDINAGGTVLAIFGQEALLYEPQRTVNINAVINEANVSPSGLNNDNHVAIDAAQTGAGPYEGYLFVGTSMPIPIPPLTPGGVAFTTTVNDSDQAVGISCNSSGGSCVAPFVFQRTSASGGTSVALTSLAPGLVWAGTFGGISNNNKGEIVVGAVDGGQVVLAWLVPHGCVNP